jgi:histidinol-phosphatase (PHP family)
MERTCARAVQMGLGAVAFTEHADPGGGWDVLARDLHDYPHLKVFVKHDRAPGDPIGGTLQPPPLDAEGYMASVQRCRDRFSELRILTGVEIGEPHRDPAVIADLLKGGSRLDCLSYTRKRPFLRPTTGPLKS